MHVELDWWRFHGGSWELEQQSQQNPGGGELQHMHWGHIGGSAAIRPIYQSPN